MVAPLLLEVFFFLAVYMIIGTAGLTLPLSQAPDSLGSLATVSANVSEAVSRELCTSSLIWTGSTSYDAEFTTNCFEAWRTFLDTDYLKYRTKEFEFLQRGATPSYPKLPKMATPRRYISSESKAYLQDRFMSLTSR